MICCLAAGAAIAAVGGFAAARRSRDTESQVEEVIDGPADSLRGVDVGEVLGISMNDERRDVELP
jgi:hypothetical protein